MFNFVYTFSKVKLSPSSGRRDRSGAQFYLGKRIDKIEPEEIGGTCAEIKISQEADNAD